VINLIHILDIFRLISDNQKFKTTKIIFIMLGAFSGARKLFILIY